MQLAASGNLRVSLTGGQAYSNVPLDVVACILSTRERMILSSFPAPPPLSRGGLELRVRPIHAARGPAQNTPHHGGAKGPRVPRMIKVSVFAVRGGITLRG